MAGLEMAKKDFALFAALRASTKHAGNYLEISTADFINFMLADGYPITPAEANKYILSQGRLKIIREGEHGLHVFGFTH